jgi:CheY-like chemotaxis protein
MAQETLDRPRPMEQTGQMAKKTFLICDSDDLARRALGQVATEQGLEPAGEATTAVQALQLLRFTPVDLVVLAHELQGLSGLDVVPELVADGYRVILVSADSWVLEQARAAGAYATIIRGDLQTFAQALSGLGLQAVEGERRSGTDRRQGVDRRVAQDWSKVIRERRVGDRRVADRRAPVAPAPVAPDIDLTEPAHQASSSIRV